MVLANQNAKLTGPDQGFLVSPLVLTQKPWERGWVNVFFNFPPILREMILLNFVLRKVESGKHDLNTKVKRKVKRNLGRDKGRMRIRRRMADTDADEKIRMRKCGWGIKRGWENADGG